MLGCPLVVVALIQLLISYVLSLKRTCGNFLQMTVHRALRFGVSEFCPAENAPPLEPPAPTTSITPLCVILR